MIHVDGVACLGYLQSPIVFQESAVDFTEIEEALVLVKQRKEREEDNLDFLHKVSDEKNKGKRKR